MIMQNIKDSIYLATIIRAFKRLETFWGRPNSFQQLDEIAIPIEKSYGTIINEAESLATGLSYSEKIMSIPHSNMEALLEGISENTSKVYQYEIVPQIISITKRSFPKKKGNEKPEIETLWKRIIENVSNLQNKDYKILADNLLDILYRYASSIPSNQFSLDISLYDQTRVATSIATCLYEVGNDTKKPFLLIGADFSGIQSYIYQIVSKYAGRNLKGRSFYLRLLSDSIVGYLLKTLNLYQSNIIYDSGGCFYLLAPNTKEVQTSLMSAVCYVEEKLFKEHGTALFVAIESIPVSKEEVSNKDNNSGLRSIWQSLFSKRDKKKYSKFAELVENNYIDFFTPNVVDGIKRDVITGEDFSKEEQAVSFNGTQYISQINQAQIALGKHLKACDCIVASEVEAECWKKSIHIKPANIGRTFYLLSLKDIIDNFGFIKDHSNDITIKLLNGLHGNCDYILPKELTYCPTNLEFYGGNTFNGNSFEEMCNNDNLSRLGVLRMDVDNLGSIFQCGIPEEKCSLARYSALSRSFDFFFSGYINEIVLRDENADKSFIIYSGGDDLFIVGEWNTTIRIAKTIRHDFKEYTCNNPAFSISGGIAILNVKFPVISGAEESALEESNAKNHICSNKKKDSISFMDVPLHWSEEYPVVEKLKDELVGYLIKKDLPKSFLSKISIHALHANFINHKISTMKTYWMMAYDLKRIMERVQKQEVRQLVMNCQRDLCEHRKYLNGNNLTTDYHPLELWAFACRWAELEYRMLNNLQ